MKMKKQTIITEFMPQNQDPLFAHAFMFHILNGQIRCRGDGESTQSLDFSRDLKVSKGF